MDIDVQQQVVERLSELPEHVREAILSVDLEKRAQEIGARHQLHIDQVGALGDAATFLLLGLTEPEDFASGLTSTLGIPADIAETLATEVGNEIFLPIREAMKVALEETEPVITPTVPPESAQVPNTQSLAVNTPPLAVPTSTPAKPGISQTTSVAIKTPVQSTPIAFSAADNMLTQKTILTPLVAPTTPLPTTPAPTEITTVPTYKTDPYHEPVE